MITQQIETQYSKSSKRNKLMSTIGNPNTFYKSKKTIKTLKFIIFI